VGEGEIEGKVINRWARGRLRAKVVISGREAEYLNLKIE
jgi:hypothetical protein